MGNSKSVSLNRKRKAVLTKFGNTVSFDSYGFEIRRKKRLNIHTPDFDNFLKEFEESLINDCRPIYDTYQAQNVSDTSIQLKGGHISIYIQEYNEMTINVGSLNTKGLKHFLNFCNSKELKQKKVLLLFCGTKRKRTLCYWYKYNYLTNIKLDHVLFSSRRQKYYFFEGLQYLSSIEKIEIDEQIKYVERPELKLIIKCAHSTSNYIAPILKVHGVHLYLLPTMKEFKIKICVESNYWTTADEQNKEKMKKYLLSAIATNLSTHCCMSLAEIKSSTAMVFDINAE